MYGDPRPDVGNTFPDFPAALFSGFIANIDTTRIQDGVHLLEVRATDTPRHVAADRPPADPGLQLQRGTDKPFGYLDEPKRDAVLYGTLLRPASRRSSRRRSTRTAHITPVRGWALDLAHAHATSAASRTSSC